MYIIWNRNLELIQQTHTHTPQKGYRNETLEKINAQIFERKYKNPSN